ncbi:6-hydroxymethylpterin diphosphokinase MptE-like protein [Sulfurimonas sp.]
MEDMESIEEQAYETYLKNIEYFNKEQKHVAKLLTIFDKALNSGDYIPTIDLEYKDGYFDVKNLNTNGYLYSEDSNKLSNKLNSVVNLNKGQYVFEGAPLYNIPDELLKNPPEDFKVVEGVLHIMKYYTTNLTGDENMIEVDKLIVIGTGLGMHISMINEKRSPKQYMIIEDNLELFKLSLFTTKYYQIAENAKLFFSIADDENSFLQTMNAFLEDQFFYNRYIKYIKFPTHTEDKIKQIQNALMTQGFIFFPYKAILFKYLKPLEYMNDQYNLLNVGGDFSNSVFKDKPVLVLAAGPSLVENTEWLKENHHKFIIIAISTVLPTLYKHNVKPDIVTQLDDGETSLKFFEDAVKDDFLDNALMLFGPNIPAKVRNMFKKEQVFYFDEGEFYVSNYTALTSPCIGSTSLILSLLLNTKEVYTLGINLAVNQETGQSHSDDYMYGYQTDTENKDKLSSIMQRTENLFQVRGNFRETVYTNAIMHASVQSLYRNMPVVKKDYQNVYNLSDGSYIYLTTPKHIKDVNTDAYENIDKDKLAVSIKEDLQKNSITKLDDNDVNKIRLRVADAKATYKKLEEYSNTITYSNKEQYLYDLLGIVSYILHKQGSESLNLTNVYLPFFKYSLTTVVDFLNTKNLKNAKRHIKKFDLLIQKEMFSIVDIYIKGLEEFLEKRC